MPHRSKKPAIAAALIGACLLVPVTYGFERGSTVPEACADTVCCLELGSICGELDDYKEHHYTSGDGSCPTG